MSTLPIRTDVFTSKNWLTDVFLFLPRNCFVCNNFSGTIDILQLRNKMRVYTTEV